MPKTGFTVTFTTTDSAVKEITTDGAATILDAAANQNVVLPSLCGQGACGTCVATITSGDYVQGPISPDAMGPMAGEGAVLLCRTTAKSDCTIDLPYDNNRIIDAAPAQRQARITALDRVADGVVRISAELVPDDVHGSAAEFDAGQFMQVDVPGTSAKRAYSMANVSNWDGQLEFYVHLIAGGKFSTWLDEQAKVDDVVTLRGPQGAFGLRENGLRPRWFVGGGTGLAQLLAMLRRMAEWGDPQPARLFVGVTTPQQLFGTEQVAELEGQLLEFGVTTCIWKPEGGELPADLAAGGPGLGEVRIGNPAEALADALEGLQDSEEVPDVYVCGPPKMVAAIEQVLAENGVAPSHVLVERIVEN